MRFISEFMHDEGVRSVALVLIGFVMGQLQDFVAARRERKKAIKMALSDLLEVHFQFAAMETILAEIENLEPIPEHLKSQLAVAYDSFLPNWDELHKRYDQSVTMVAGLDPLLAFKLRSKDLIRPAMKQLHALMGQNAQGAAIMAPVIRASFANKIEPLLRKSVITLAKKLGPLCWYNTLQALQTTKSNSDEVRELVKRMKEIVAPHVNAPAPPPSSSA
jgi:hypothetical protein